MSVVRQPINERRIPGRGPLGPLGPVLTAVCALLTGRAVLAGWEVPRRHPLSSPTNTFLPIRPWCIGDPQWSKVQAYLNGGSAPVFNDHRFWADADIATAFESFAQLFPTAQLPPCFQRSRQYPSSELITPGRAPGNGNAASRGRRAAGSSSSCHPASATGRRGTRPMWTGTTA